MTKVLEALGKRWLVPVFCVLVGGGLGALFLARGQTVHAVVAAGGLLAYGGLLTALSARSETVAVLRGQLDDERRALINLRASAMVAHVLIIALLTGFVVQIARGADPSPWGQLSALAGLTYLAALVFAIRRG